MLSMIRANMCRKTFSGRELRSTRQDRTILNQIRSYTYRERYVSVIAPSPQCRVRNQEPTVATAFRDDGQYRRETAPRQHCATRKVCKNSHSETTQVVERTPQKGNISFHGSSQRAVVTTDQCSEPPFQWAWSGSALRRRPAVDWLFGARS